MAKQAAQEKGVQKPSAVSDLNNPEKDAARAEKVDSISTGDEILHASDRSKIFERYKQFEKKELSDLGIDSDALDKELDELGEDEKPEEELEGKEEGTEEEDALEGKEKPDGKEQTEDEDKEEPEEKADDAEKEKPEPEPEGSKAKAAEGIKIEDVLSFEIPIKVDGIDGKVTVAEMQKSYQLQGHLTRQLQDVARQKAVIDNAAQQVAQQRAALEAEFKNYEEQLFSPEEIASRKASREQKARDQQASYQNLFLQCRNTLYSRHADLDQLDHDPAFVEWRQNFAPMVNEQLLESYGPGVFFPAVDLVLSSYKEIKRLENELKAKTDATAQLKKERADELRARETKQRELKKQTSKDVKPSTAREASSDIPSNADGGRDYVRKMKENRLRLQGLSPKTP